MSLDVFKAFVLGIVEGLTEFLPVSSTGHLLLLERFFGFDDDAFGKTFVVLIQLGAILAILSIYFLRLWNIALGFFTDPAARRFVIGVLIAFLPAAVVGVVAEDWIDAHLFGLWPVVAAWFVGGVALLALARRLRGGAVEIEHLGAGAALGIGLFQCLALWPGTSRSLATIAGGLLLGLTMSAAVEFSLLLGLITLTAATAWKALHHGGAIVANYGIATPALGFLCAAVSAWVAVRWMLAFLQARGLAAFGVYRIALAAVVAACIVMGAL